MRALKADARRLHPGSGPGAGGGAGPR
jgi:hypothetical protein